MTDPIHKLTELFQRLPGIGPRQARRFVYYILQSGSAYSSELSSSLANLKSTVSQCPMCMRYFIKNKNETCELCLRPGNREQLLIVEKDADLENIKRSGSYHGLYFVLGGLLPILEENPDSRIKIHELRRRLKEEKELKEVILALSANPLGDNTIEYLRPEIAKYPGIKITTLGRGISTGAELEYSDSDTLSNALENRK